jgi:2-polyprenyl-3-methyl-5-hydroxy-6-metoxy-1,4-benzoquinol methylase
MQSEDQVKAHFRKQAVRFDTIYENEKRLWQKFVDKFFRQVVKDRFDLTFREITELKGKSILDVGCGSGRYALEFARRGAHRIIGIDYAQEMIKLAKGYAEKTKDNANCKFVCGDFVDYDFGEQFDYAVAMGFFDYLKDPSPYLAKMKNLTRSGIIASFPKKRTFRGVIRKIRLFLAGCPVYFYSRKEIEGLLRENQISEYKILELSRDLIMIARISQSNRKTNC